jgi:hypothetical protein
MPAQRSGAAENADRSEQLPGLLLSNEDVCSNQKNAQTVAFELNPDQFLSEKVFCCSLLPEEQQLIYARNG